MRPRIFFLLATGVVLVAASGCANRPPVLNCQPDLATVTEGDSVTIQSNVTDPDKNEHHTFDWSATSGKVTPQNESAVFNSSGLKPGRYTVSLTVQDKKQNTASCSVHVDVRKNKQPPTISCQPTRAQVTEGHSTSLGISASDPNHDALTYSWSVDGRSISNNSTHFEFGTAGRSIGAHRVRATVTDVDGMTASCDIAVNINRRPNRNPTVHISVNKGEVYAGQSVVATAQASDPDGDPLTYSWSVDGQSRSGGSSSLNVNTSGLGGGSHTVSVRVRDDRGGSASGTSSFKVREKVVIQIERRPDNVAKAKLDEIALKMQQNPQLHALITGHTDSYGSERNNERVGLRRANAVKDYLVKEHGIDAGRIETASKGETAPIADNKTREGRKENRRAEIELFVP